MHAHTEWHQYCSAYQTPVQECWSWNISEIPHNQASWNLSCHMPIYNNHYTMTSKVGSKQADYKSSTWTTETTKLLLSDTPNPATRTIRVRTWHRPNLTGKAILKHDCRYVACIYFNIHIPSIKVWACEVHSIATDKHVALEANLQHRRGTDWTNNTGYERLASSSLYGTSDVHKLWYIRERERERVRLIQLNTNELCLLHYLVAWWLCDHVGYFVSRALHSTKEGDFSGT